MSSPRCSELKSPVMMGASLTSGTLRASRCSGCVPHEVWRAAKATSRRASCRARDSATLRLMTDMDISTSRVGNPSRRTTGGPWACS